MALKIPVNKCIN